MNPVASPRLSQSTEELINGRISPLGRAGYAVEKTTKNPPVNLSDLRSLSDVDEEFRVRMARQHGTDVLRNALKGAPALGSSNATNSPTPEKHRASRGSRGLTSHGRKIIMGSVEYLEWRFGRRNLAFSTVTLPSMNDEEAARSIEEWGAIVKTFVKSLGRKLNGQNLPNWIVGAFENQPRRSDREKRPVLHFHFVFVARPPNRNWAVTCLEVREKWRSAVISRIPSLANVNFSATENVQRVKRSVGAYLSKYISKGTGLVAHVAKVEPQRHPNSWFSCSLRLRRIVSRSVRSGRFIGTFLSSLESDRWYYKEPVTITDSDGYSYTVGWFGQLKPGWSELLDVPVFIPIEESDAKVFQFPFSKVFHDGFYSIVLNVGLAHYTDKLQLQTQSEKR